LGSSTDNIDIFNDAAALVFSELYSSFPVPVCLNYGSLATKLCDTDQTIAQAQGLIVLINTVAWLRKSGYIWLDSESELEVFGVVLNPRGLEILKLRPDAPEDDTTIGERLADTGNVTTREERAALIRLALTEGCRML